MRNDQSPFAVGDRVRVMDASGANGALKVGQIHEVSGVTYPAVLHLRGVPSYWSARRFEKVEAPAPFAVGDRVRVVDDSDTVGALKVGQIHEVSSVLGPLPAMLRLDGVPFYWAARRFEKVEAPAKVPVPAPFAVGDRVRVVDASDTIGFLKLGQTYQVSSVLERGPACALVRLHGVPADWQANRFEKVEAPAKAPADPTPFAVGDRVRVRPTGASSATEAGEEGVVLAIRRTFPGCWFVDVGGLRSFPVRSGMAAWRFERAPEPGQVGGDAIDQLVADLEAALQTWRRAKIARAVRA